MTSYFNGLLSIERNGSLMWNPKPFHVNDIHAATVGVVSGRYGLSYCYQYLIEMSLLGDAPSHFRVVTFREVAATFSSKVLPVITIEHIGIGYSWAYDALDEYKGKAKQYITRSDIYGMLLIQARHNMVSIRFKQEITRFRESNSLVANPWYMSNIEHQEYKIIGEQLD